MSEEWRTSTFRQSMIHKIEEQIQQFQIPMAKNVTEMESHVYSKSTSKEDYLNYIAKLLMYIKNYTKKSTGTMGMQGANNPNAAQKGMQGGPIRALQSLAMQGSGNNANNMGMQGPVQNQPNMGQQVGPSGGIATNLLQSLTQPRQGQPMTMQQAMHNKMSGMNMMQGQQMGMNHMGQMQNMQGNPMINQINQMNSNSMPPQMGPQTNQGQQIGGPPMGPNQIQQAMQNQMQNQMQNHQMGGTMNPGIQSTMQPQQSPSQQQHMNTAQMNVNPMAQQLNHMQRKTNEMMTPAYTGQRNMTPNQFLSQSPSPSAPSPSGLGAPGSNQMVPSPALVPSPNPQHTMLGSQRSMAMAPSPSTSLNTPAGMIGGAVPSPLQDDQISQACKEKIQKLRKFIDPLNKMIIKLTNEGYTEKISKVKKLLEILTNPSSVTKLDVLQKCEVVLEKMELKKYEATTGPQIPSSLKEHYFLTPLLEVVNTILQNPVANHTLHRTFSPCVEALFGPEIKDLPPKPKRRKVEEPTSEIPDVLQGEIARLDQRFKVSLDPAQQSGSKCIQLICWLDDKHLPCVPPVLVIVPMDYPKVPPKCVLASHEYATPYLSAVQNALDARLAKFPKRFSISQLLDTWETSVRQACNPKASQVMKENESTDAATTVPSNTGSVTNSISSNLISTGAS
ncbi:mediator of RNA polymerase II transcription subunit 15 [Copidosoma floridanum]|uniref:mediator of RNA polymerase II transcription subunit 15 n=1 Tax=Copidosoma floridanum TaxID=29053 RepID=UPI0006C95815|nr:mediator of RNA polymerase II transcription subunit 15 [Copidosoma floridanum]